jgi:hypothetical protein
MQCTSGMQESIALDGYHHRLDLVEIRALSPAFLRLLLIEQNPKLTLPQMQDIGSTKGACRHDTLAIDARTALTAEIYDAKLAIPREV